MSQAHSEWAHDQETAVREAVGVAKTEWEEESHKRVESALKEQEAIWQKRYLQAICKTFHLLSTTLV